jgi:hypothetical protein
MMFARSQQAVAAATFTQNSGWSLKHFSNWKQELKKYLFFKGETILFRINFVRVDDASTEEDETRMKMEKRIAGTW